MPFHCSKCGLCCRNISKIPQLSLFDNGNGVCIYLGKDNLCSIYANRPEICKVDLMYEKHFKSSMTIEEWYKLNEKGCLELKNTLKKGDEM